MNPLQVGSNLCLMALLWLRLTWKRELSGVVLHFCMQTHVSHLVSDSPKTGPRERGSLSQKTQSWKPLSHSHVKCGYHVQMKWIIKFTKPNLYAVWYKEKGLWTQTEPCSNPQLCLLLAVVPCSSCLTYWSCFFLRVSNKWQFLPIYSVSRYLVIWSVTMTTRPRTRKPTPYLLALTLCM